MNSINPTRIANALYGMAYGDAWGKDVEFLNFNEIKAQNPDFPEEALITDDTQMSLYALSAIFNHYQTFVKFENNIRDTSLRTQVRLAFAEEFLLWLHDPRNNREPGNTCLKALRTYEASLRLTGKEGIVWESKGCGANMRNPWFGLLPCSEDFLEEISILQSEVTHGHPLALASAVLTAFVVREVFLEDLPLGSFRLYGYVAHKTETLLKKALKRREAGNEVREDYIKGLQQLLDFWGSRRQLVVDFELNPDVDPCEALKAEGWVAEEALLLAAVIADAHRGNYVDTLKAMVYTSGDSDSIAAIGGTILGAYSKGEQVFPSEWKDALEPEYVKEIEEYKEALVLLHKSVEN